MSDDLRLLDNPGIFTLNISHHPAQRTIVVLGVGRGGTTMVAGVLTRLGVSMGTRMAVAHEDGEIKAITKKFPKKEWMSNLAPVFEARNREFDVWGFKLPRISRMTAELEMVLRNPYFVFIFRDPVAISIRNVVSADLDLLHSMRHALESYQIFARYLSTSSVPCVVLSYEKAILRPEATVRALMTHLGLTASEDQINDAAIFIEPSPEEYVRRSVRKSSPA